MFDIGFTEILLVSVVALVVIGPEKLPSVIRQLLIHIKNIKSQISTIKSDVEDELNVHDIKQQISDEKENIRNVVGYDELHESLDELNEIKNQSIHPADFLDDELVSQETIDTTNKQFIDQDYGPHLPHPDEHADTGIEEPVSDNSASITQSKNSNTHDNS